MSEWFHSAFKKFAEFTPLTWGILAVLLIGGYVVYRMTRSGKRWSTHMVANAAMCIAIAFILSYIRLYRMPLGGSVTLASMLPIFLFAYAYGVGPGLAAGLAYGVFQFIQGGYVLSPVQVILEYPLAFALLGLAGIAHGSDSKAKMLGGMLLGAFGRFFCAFLAGVVFWGKPEDYAGSVLLYSFIYNGAYMLPDTIICMVLAFIPAVQKLARMLPQTDSRR
ncbi:MAG: energy-coupled thiamine transporter ThiT [Clostridia bacterium]|nr:energy-coupled thiamine transporter ThiT [Clostridia bacterium]